YYTVLDLTGAFFSIPIAEQSQHIFAFTWQGKQLTWTRLPQGFTSSPTIFSQILRNDLQDLNFPRLSVLIQYVDDLLLVIKPKENCIRDTKYLCCQLVQKGHRVSPSKLQFCQTKVKYLGFLLSPGKIEIDAERVKIIQELPRPTTKKQLRGFFGQVGFCRPWIPGFSEIAKPLHEATRNEEVKPITWGSKREKAFRTLKNALLNAPALGLPDYSKPFKLY
ncbi:hypothetical protein N306_10444, partial [Opisthocomus hoazin]